MIFTPNAFAYNYNNYGSNYIATGVVNQDAGDSGVNYYTHSASNQNYYYNQNPQNNTNNQNNTVQNPNPYYYSNQNTTNTSTQNTTTTTKAATKTTTASKTTDTAAKTAIVDTGTKYNDMLSANAIFASNGFLPSNFFQWLIFFIIILAIVFLWRKLYVSDLERHAPLKHA